MINRYRLVFWQDGKGANVAYYNLMLLLVISDPFILIGFDEAILAYTTKQNNQRTRH
jgi:hypothetical protein